MKRQRSDESLTRLAFFPIENSILETFYHEQKNTFWTPQEINYAEDRSQFDRLDADTQKYVKFILFLFAQLDGIVSENLCEHFKRETSVFAKECGMFYSIQEAIEWIHNETYSLLIKTLIKDPSEQERGLNSIRHFPEIKNIANWCYSYMKPELNLLERVIAFICVEGIIFSSAFAGIYWLKRKNILPAVTKANEFIARDEGLHTKFGISLYHHITKKWNKMERLPIEKVHEVIKSAVSVTETFTREAMNCHLVGIDAEEMIMYVKRTADVVCESLNYETIYNVRNPFDWMAIISLPNKSNFFESTPTEYAREKDDDFIFDKNTPF